VGMRIKTFRHFMTYMWSGTGTIQTTCCLL
jgi:hypothetical protein